jgi:general secretion pathway protein I
VVAEPRAGARRQPSRARRRGMSLLEVLVALAIFLSALIVLGRLVILGGERARDVQGLAQATQLCQSKMAEVVAGVVPLNSQSGTPFDEDPAWTWSLDCSQGDIANLWDVTVTVTRQRADGSKIESTLTQKVLDPSMRGHAADAVLTMPAPSTGSSSSGSSPSGTSSSSGSGASAPSTQTGNPSAKGG